MKKTLLLLASLLMFASSIALPTPLRADESGNGCGLAVCPKP